MGEVSPDIGRRIGKYEIVGEISEGGMGKLYRARARGPGDLEREVALKVIRPEVQRREGFAEMFVQEAEILSKLSHGNLVHMLDYGVEGGEAFLCLELVRGKDFSKWLEHHRRVLRRRFPPRLTLRIVEQVARGLEYASRMKIDGKGGGLIHRDVSPSNILISFDGGVKLTDFGVAKIPRDRPLTRAGVIKGKLRYMSPEQITGQRIDPRSDVFALGIVLWEALAGRHLFWGHGAAIAEAVLREKIKRPSEVADDLPEELDGIVLKALERKVERRYESAGELAEDLAELGRRRKTIADDREVGQALRQGFPADVPAVRLDLGTSIRPSSGLVPTVKIRLPPLPVAPEEDGAPTVADSRPDGAQRTGETPTTPASRATRLWRPAAGIAAALAGIGWLVVRSPAGKPAAVAPERPAVAQAVPPAPVPTVRPAPAPLAARPAPLLAGMKLPDRAVARPRPKAEGARKPGVIDILGVIPVVDIVVDGLDRDWSPKRGIPVSAGRHRVVLRPESGPARRFRVVVPAAGRVVFQGALASLTPEIVK